MCQDCQEDPNVEAKQNNEDIKTTTEQDAHHEEQDLQNNNDVQDKSVSLPDLSNNDTELSH